MKKLAYQLIAVSTIVCACAQTLTPPKLEWRATVKVVDEANQPIVGASVEVWYYVKPPPGQSEASEKITGLTDTNGNFSTTHPDTKSMSLSFRVGKPGYYTASGGYELGLKYDPKNWDRSSTFALKKVGRPTAMYAKRIRQGPPVAEKSAGYDLEVGDWVSPYGKGNTADMIFTAHLDRRADNDSDYKLVVSFPKPGDGIQPFTISELEKTSALRSPHEAPPEGYQPQWVKTNGQRPGEATRYSSDENLNFFFRVRTILDDSGNVKSANYGKIYGDFMDFQYFLNPEVNSRSVEFDPAKNLLKPRGPDEQVRIP
jgi:hypothetical protein